jgi:hypothetical protein
MAFLCLVQGIEVPAVQSGYYWVTKVRKYVAETEREPSTGLKEIIGQPTEVAGLGAQYDNEIRVLATVPAGAVFRLVGVTEGDVVFEGDQLESSLTDALQDAFFEQESIRVRHKGKSCDLRGELL